MVSTETTEVPDDDMGDGLEPVPQRFWRPIGTQRVLQIVLGFFWLLDAGLQFQSYMFHRSFVETYVLNNANGQPAVVSWVITNIGHFIEPHVAAWNTFFALIQVVIGLGLLYRPTVRYALALSFAWALGVWVLGEGLGMDHTGTASALTGAPGSVFMYALIGLLAWPTNREPDDASFGVASSAAARGVGGSATALVVWAGYWSLAAVFFLLPQNRTTTSISGAITGMQSGEPSAYSHFLHGVGSTLSSTGTEWAWVLAVLSVIVGFGPLLSRRPGVFLAVGAVLSVAWWVSGQGLGGIFTGSGTDPNTGPLIVVLAMAMTPARVAPPYVGLTPLSAVLAPARRAHGPRPRRVGVSVVPQRGLPGRLRGVIEHGDERHDRHGRVRRPATGEQPEHGELHWLGSLRVGGDQQPAHGDGRERHDEHERRRCEQRRRPQLDEGQLALHGASAPGLVDSDSLGRRREQPGQDLHGRGPAARRSQRSPTRSARRSTFRRRARPSLRTPTPRPPRPPDTSRCRRRAIRSSTT